MKHVTKTFLLQWRFVQGNRNHPLNECFTFHFCFFLSVDIWCYCDRWSICCQVCWNYGSTGKRWFLLTAVYRWKWLGRKKLKQTRLKLCWKVLEPPHLLFYPRWLCMSNILIAMYLLLLVGCLSTHDHLLYFARFLCRDNPQNGRQKHTTKKTLLFFLWTISFY